jgi:hypothetical protein
MESLVDNLLNEDASSIVKEIVSSVVQNRGDNENKNDLSIITEKLSEVCTLLSSLYDTKSINDTHSDEQQSTNDSKDMDLTGMSSQNLKSSSFDRSNASLIPLEVCRQVSESGYLTAKETGRFLLLTSSKISTQLGHNFIWGCLSSSLIPNLSTFPALSTYSQEWLFRQLSKPVAVPTRRWPPLPPPPLSSESIIMFIQWFSDRTDPTPIATIQIPNNDLEVFINTGQVTLSDVAIPTNSNGISFQFIDMHKIFVRIVCLRNDRHQCCCLHETGEYSWDLTSQQQHQRRHQHIPLTVTSVASILHPPPPRATATWNNRPNNRHNGRVVGDIEGEDGENANDDDDDESPFETANLYLGPKTAVVLGEESGRDLETRLARGDRDVGGFELLVVAHVVRPKANPDDSSVAAIGALPWTVNGLSIQFWANYNEMLYIYNSQEQIQKHGVTMLHLLDQLLGWTDC